MNNDTAMAVLGGGAIMTATLAHLAQLNGQAAATATAILSVVVAVAVTAYVVRRRTEVRNEELRELRSTVARIRTDQQKARKVSEKFEVEADADD